MAVDLRAPGERAPGVWQWGSGVRDKDPATCDCHGDRPVATIRGAVQNISQTKLD